MLFVHIWTLPHPFKQVFISLNSQENIGHLGNRHVPKIGNTDHLSSSLPGDGHSLNHVSGTSRIGEPQQTSSSVSREADMA